MERSFMKRMQFTVAVLASTLAISTGCRQLPGSNEQQGAVIGGASGAIVGAAVAENNLLGALIGGAAGAAGGYLIGANADRITGRDSAGAERAVQSAQTSPATAEQARNSADADINNDGFVTLDEVAALEAAGYSDQDILNRLRATGQVFELTGSQQQRLRDQGVSQNVISEMSQINRETRERLLNNGSSEVISRPK
jgi:hypothetical protein